MGFQPVSAVGSGLDAGDTGKMPVPRGSYRRLHFDLQIMEHRRIR